MLAVACPWCTSTTAMPNLSKENSCSLWADVSSTTKIPKSVGIFFFEDQSKLPFRVILGLCMLVTVNYHVVEKKLWERVNNPDMTKKKLDVCFQKWE